MVVVLDACALIAYLTGEKGSDVVSDAICKHDCVIHVLNWCEVCYDFLKRENDVQMVEEALWEANCCGLLVNDNYTSLFGTQDNRVTDQIEKRNLRYIDKQKSSAWDTLSGQKLSDGTNLSTWMLKQNFSIRNVHTEEDLVKAREQSRTRYSLAQKPSGAPQK